MYEEALHVKNFGGIEKMTLEVKSMTVIIGPQAAGKSITAKLLYYFKSFFQEIYRACEEGLDKRKLDGNYRDQFIAYFPRESWPEKSFKIVYEIKGEEIIVEKKLHKVLKFEYSQGIKKAFSECKKIFDGYRSELHEKPSMRLRSEVAKPLISFNQYIKSNFGLQASFNQLFIPAGRSFFANLQSTIFSFLSDNRSLDPFLVEFGSYYEIYKSSFLNNQKNDQLISEDELDGFDLLVNQVLNGEYVRDKEKDYLLHGDKRKVNIVNASSGQQEILPLLIILKALIIRRSVDHQGATLYIEEPEAHLFPTAQKKIVELLATLFKNKGERFQFVITTHSPYLLSSLNNLIEAGAIGMKLDEITDETYRTEKLKELNDVVPGSRHIDPDYIATYALENGELRNLLDKESGLISAESLDAVSSEIAIEFGDLLALQAYE